VGDLSRLGSVLNTVGCVTEGHPANKNFFSWNIHDVTMRPRTMMTCCRQVTALQRIPGDLSFRLNQVLDQSLNWTLKSGFKPKLRLTSVLDLV